MKGLREWAKAYLRHRDLFERRISSLKESEHGFLIIRKDGTRCECLINESLAALTPLLSKGEVLLVTRNTRENLSALIKEWRRLANHPKLKVIFANTALNERWAINPRQHTRVAEEESLARGLEALFLSVPEG